MKKFSLAINNFSAPNLARVIVYGAPKTRKTWWAGTAAKTHRVWLLDGENGATILNQLPEAYQKNISRIPLGVNPGQASFATFIKKFAEMLPFIWAANKGSVVLPSQADDQEDLYIAVDQDKLNSDDVIIIDSWTTIVQETVLLYTQLNNLNILQPKKRDYAFYDFQNQVLDTILSTLNKLPCHVILIGHAYEYEYELEDISDNGFRKKSAATKRKIGIQSCTSKHSQKVPANFGEVLYFENKDENTTLINTGSSPNREGGCRSIAANVFQFPGWEWKDFIASAGILPAKDMKIVEPAFAGYVKNK